MFLTKPLFSALRAGALLVMPTVAVCVGLLEGGLRLQGRMPSNATEAIFLARGEAYRLRPGQTKVVHTPSYTCTVHTNALGQRDSQTGTPSLAQPYLAWLGDSATFGNGVDYEQTFVGRFDALARPRGYRSINLAVGGHHLAEQLETLDDFLAVAERKPEAVVFVFTPQLLALFERRHHDLVERSGYMYPKDGWLVPYLLVTLGDVSSAYGFVRDGVRKVQSKLFPTGPAPLASMLEPYSRTSPLASPDMQQRLEAALDRADARIRQAGATPVHVLLPTTADLRAGEILGLIGARPSDYDFDRLRALLRRQGQRGKVTVVDLTDVLQAEHARGKPMGFLRDMHYNALSHEVIGRALHDELLGRAGKPPSDARPVPGGNRP